MAGMLFFIVNIWIVVVFLVEQPSSGELLSRAVVVNGSEPSTSTKTKRTSMDRKRTKAQ